MTGKTNDSGIKSGPGSNKDGRTGYGAGKPRYQVNWVSTPRGNGIKSGSRLNIEIRNALFITGQIRDAQGRLILIGQSHKNDKDKRSDTLSILLKRKGRMSLRNHGLKPGTYELKCCYWDEKTNTGGGYTEKFEIIP